MNPSRPIGQRREEGATSTVTSGMPRNRLATKMPALGASALGQIRVIASRRGTVRVAASAEAFDFAIASALAAAAQLLGTHSLVDLKQHLG